MPSTANFRFVSRTRPRELDCGSRWGGRELVRDSRWGGRELDRESRWGGRLRVRLVVQTCYAPFSL